MNEEKTLVTIVKVVWADNTEAKEKLRTKEWLLKISEILDLDGGSSTNESPLKSEAEESKQEEEKSSLIETEK